MFLGRHQHNLDAKGRLAIPARFRDALSDGVVLTRGIDRCLALYPMVAWSELAGKISALPVTDPDARALRRMVFAEAIDLHLDAQGRIIVPADLRNYAGLERELFVIGMDAFIEIWNPDRWATVQAALDDDGIEVARRLSEM